jgi:uncharacterized RDD family membrane protein YckC
VAEERWYYNDAGTSVGPFTRQRLLELARAHLILPSTPVWRNGMIDWAPMAEAVHEGRAEGLDPPRLEPPVERAYPEPAEPDEVPAAISDERGWSTLPVAPWRRYGARAIDTSINGLLGVMLLAYAWYSLAPRSADDFFSLVETPGGLLLDLVLTTFIAAIVGGFVVGATGTSIGKLVFGVRVLDANLRPIGIRRGLAREFHIWWAGLALGIPLLVLFTLLAAYRRLQRDQTTAWDRDTHLVLHRPRGTLQTVLNGVGILLVVLVNVLMRALAEG